MSEENLFPLEEFVQRIAPRLPSKEQQARLQDLLDRAARGDPEAGFDLDDAVLDLPPAAQDWLKEKYRIHEQHQRGMETLPGQISLLSASQRWVCPEENCPEDEPVLQEGEEPPECPRHRRKMIRASRKKDHAG